MRQLKLRLISVSSAVTYRFEPTPDDKGNRDFGWALCSVNDSTGELSIQSDWGNWSHRWNVNHLGSPSLTHFIADRTSCHYLADKLSRENGTRSGEEFDVDETIAKFRRMLAERRLEEARAWIEHYRDDPPEDTPDVLLTPPRWADKKPYGYDIYGKEGEPLTRGIAREIWDAIGSLHECGRSADLFCERFFRVDGYAWITEEPWEHTVYTPTPGYRVLLGSILPALVDACVARIGERAA